MFLPMPKEGFDPADTRPSTFGRCPSRVAHPAGVPGHYLHSGPGWTRTTALLLVGKLPSPLGYRTKSNQKWTHRESHPLPFLSCWQGSVCRTDVFLLDHEPEFFIATKRKPWDSNPQAGFPAACFQDRFLIRPDDFRSLHVAGAGIQPGTEPKARSLRVQSPASRPAVTVPQCMSVEGHAIDCEVRELRGQESNLRTRGSKPRISTSRNYPAVGEGRVGLEPTRWCLTNTCSAAELPTRSKVPCGNRTRLSRVEAWYLCRSVKGTVHLMKAEAVGLEPTTGNRSRLLSRQVPHPAG